MRGSWVSGSNERDHTLIYAEAGSPSRKGNAELVSRLRMPVAQASVPVWQLPNLCRARLHRLRKKSAILSFRAQRGICFFTHTRKKADSSGKPRPRNDSFGVFPEPL